MQIIFDKRSIKIMGYKCGCVTDLHYMDVQETT